MTTCDVIEPSENATQLILSYINNILIINIKIILSN